MAKITLTIEDTPQGTVKIVSDPSFETMMKMDISGSNSLTAAHGYAFALINKAREIGKDPNPIQNRIPIIRG